MREKLFELVKDRTISLDYALLAWETDRFPKRIAAKLVAHPRHGDRGKGLWAAAIGLYDGECAAVVRCWDFMKARTHCVLPCASLEEAIDAAENWARLDMGNLREYVSKGEAAHD